MKKTIKIDETNGSLGLNLIPAMLYVQKVGEKFNGVTNHLGLVVSSCRCVVTSRGVVAFVQIWFYLAMDSLCLCQKKIMFPKRCLEHNFFFFFLVGIQKE
jgi:hypothetical protein